MALKNKLLIILSFLTGIIVITLLAGVLFLYRPDFFLSLIFGKKTTKIAEQQIDEKLTGKELIQIEEIVARNLSLIKEGITIHPAIIFKIEQNNNSTEVYVLTTSELEWPFVKTIVRGNITLNKIRKVYKCSDVYILDYNTEGMVIPPVKSGPFIDKGVIVPGFEGQKPIVAPFYGDCKNISGLVFNQFGDFSGVCKNQDFIPASWIDNLNLSTCSLVYGNIPETNKTENTTLANTTENSSINGTNATSISIDNKTNNNQAKEQFNETKNTSEITNNTTDNKTNQ